MGNRQLGDCRKQTFSFSLGKTSPFPLRKRKKLTKKWKCLNSHRRWMDCIVDKGTIVCMCTTHNIQ
uniref:Uncharacterized protein n=1 Tax=Picea sitchensis TaxID=3332 RepID=D5AA66_PICSI|nr:unknown [Picea sitchensis]